MKRLLNPSEEKALNQLNEIIQRYGLKVNSKVRVADVLPIDKSGIADDLFGYALTSHFDFLLTDEDYQPQFAVEFDGPHHDHDEKTKELDAKKDALCERFGLPLLRVKLTYLPKRYNKLSLLQWVIDVYHLKQAFEKAQMEGSIPEDEPFDPFLLFITHDGHTEQLPYFISGAARDAVRHLHEEGKVRLPGTSGLILRERSGLLRGLEYIETDDTHGIMVKFGMRPQLFPIDFTDLHSELLFISLYDKLKRYLELGDGLDLLSDVRAEFQQYRSTGIVVRAHVSIGPNGENSTQLFDPNFPLASIGLGDKT